MTTIRISCPEGHKLVIREEHAGKKIRCPKCQAIMQAPAGDAEAAATVSVPKKVRRPAFVCPSGHRFLVRSDQFGQQVSCPLCEQTVRTPAPGQPATTGNGSPHITNPLAAVAGSTVDEAGQVVPDSDSTSAPPQKAWPLMVLVGSAAVTLVGIAAWVGQQTDL